MNEGLQTLSWFQSNKEREQRNEKTNGGPGHQGGVNGVQCLCALGEKDISMVLFAKTRIAFFLICN